MLNKIVEGPKGVSQRRFADYIYGDFSINSYFDHENIVKIHYKGINEKGDGISIMELVEKGSLRDLINSQIKKGEFFEDKFVLDIISGINKGLLAAIQRYSYVHNDIKPENILITADGTPKICDFGLSKHEKYEKNLDKPIGTDPYMHPWMKFLKEMDKQNDEWAVMLIFYELITLRSINLYRTK